MVKKNTTSGASNASEDATSGVPKKKSHRNLILGIIFVAINVLVIALTAANEFGDSSKAADLASVKINWLMLLPAVLCFVIALLAEIYKYYMVVRDTTGVKAWKIARNTVLLGRYYDNLTPAAIGGQPFQIYYMNKSGIRDGYGTTTPLVGMISDQFGFIILGFFGIIIGSFLIPNSSVVAAGTLFLMLSGILPSIILLATFFPKIVTEIAATLIKFLAKVHIVKNPEEKIKKTTEALKTYAECIKKTLKVRGLFLKLLLLSIVYYGALACIPFFVLTAFGGQVGFLSSVATTIAVTAAVYFVPTPGNAGAAESVFYLVFSGISSGYVFWAMLVWRIFTYYGFLAIGGILQLSLIRKKDKALAGWSKGMKNVEKKIDERPKKQKVKKKDA